MIAALKVDGFDDVTPAFASILPLIELTGTRQTDIARQGGMSKQAVGQLVKELVARGYLALDKDPADQRATSVRFTERGLRLRQRGFAIKTEQEERLAAILGVDALRHLSFTLEALLRALRV